MPDIKGPVEITAAVEGLLDEVVARKLIVLAGGKPGTVYGKNGKQDLRRQIQGYNRAAQHSLWMVLIDMDHDTECAPPLREEWVPKAAANLCFRVAVREVEAWLMADGESFASFLNVARRTVPTNPEQLLDPKMEMVNLARRSRCRKIREDMVPRKAGRRSVGPAYTSRLIEYVETLWRPDIAMSRADSLSRAIKCLQRMIERVTI